MHQLHFLVLVTADEKQRTPNPAQVAQAEPENRSNPVSSTRRIWSNVRWRLAEGSGPPGAVACSHGVSWTAPADRGDGGPGVTNRPGDSEAAAGGGELVPAGGEGERRFGEVGAERAARDARGRFIWGLEPLAGTLLARAASMVKEA